MARAKGLGLHFAPCERPVGLRTDKVKLARVLANLITNAIKFTETGGVTVTGALAPGQEVVIRVSDTGMGIAPGNLEGIFGEFAQLRHLPDAEKRGWGLGLAICKRLIGMLDGRITVRELARPRQHVHRTFAS